MVAVTRIELILNKKLWIKNFFHELCNLWIKIPQCSNLTITLFPNFPRFSIEFFDPPLLNFEIFLCNFGIEL